ncbi:phosphatidate cytidylyltransferase [Wielerella bovis]|uniref:phosphatidate cytidylyltransferase n=1 Tax=Wielerella bovis TaxID=2917790 RepID=UPI0020188E20|nr:phosphatidate cytidylyltransferase [Wielerella bovis]ULJ64537.1 phosphatidate cytidylyltransferase [Wielerella bovis]ULJ66826.1 phosphatidate cytidylyltransferase [Wielerella bovis]ULJ69049.1 phosphatidate cytidylyltransferase [Wielerella bovis]
MPTSNFPALAAMVFAGIFVLLAIAAFSGYLLQKRPQYAHNLMLKEFNTRVYSWFAMTVILLVAFWLGRSGMILLFLIASYAAMREFMSQVYRYRGDHNAVATCFYILLPLQYYFIWTDWHSMFTVLIPVYAFLLLPIIVQLSSGSKTEFFERTAKIQWGVMITVYCLSHVPALMSLPIKHFAGKNILLLLFMLVVVHTGDVAYYLWRRTGGTQGGRRTTTGAIVSIVIATFVATCLFWITPFNPFQAALTGLLLSVMGFFGGTVMQQIKHSFGIHHWGRPAPRGHSSVLDRADSICFAAPVFYHIVRYYWT